MVSEMLQLKTWQNCDTRHLLRREEPESAPWLVHHVTDHYSFSPLGKDGQYVLGCVAIVPYLYVMRVATITLWESRQETELTNYLLWRVHHDHNHGLDDGG